MSKTDYEFIIFLRIYYVGRKMVEGVWWNEVPLVSNSEGVFFFGVINVPVYEAPKELVVNKVLKKLRFIFFVYITNKERKA